MLVNPIIISTKCIDLLLSTFKTGHLLLIMMITDCINLLRKKDDSRTIFNSSFLGRCGSPVFYLLKMYNFTPDPKLFSLQILEFEEKLFI